MVRQTNCFTKKGHEISLSCKVFKKRFPTLVGPMTRSATVLVAEYILGLFPNCAKNRDIILYCELIIQTLFVAILPIECNLMQFSAI